MTDKEKLNMLLEAIDYSFWNPTEKDYNRELTYPVIDKVKFVKRMLQEEPANKDLEEAAKENARYERGDSVETLYDLNRAAGFIDGAQWQKEQMMKEAIDTEASYTMSVPCITISLPLGVNVGDKVKVLIIKNK